MVFAHLVDALGLTRGRSYERLKGAIPVAPGGVDITLNGSAVRLWRTRVGTATNSPEEIVCAEV